VDAGVERVSRRWADAVVDARHDRRKALWHQVCLQTST
jgi:hypothetical protein